MSIQADRIEIVKNIVEIIAIIVAGLWGGYEYIAQQTIKRLEGESYSWASLKLETDKVNLTADRHWLHAKLTVTNGSKRVVKPLLVTWRIRKPPLEGSVDPVSYKLWNEADWDQIRPGQETERSYPIIIEGKPSAVLVEVDFYYRNTKEDEECIFQPNQFKTGETVDNIKSQPLVLSSRSHSAENIKMQRKELRVPI